MTKQEIQDKLSAIRKNNALPEKQKGMLLDKYEKMLVDATMSDPDSGKITKAPRAPQSPRAPKAPATAPVKPGMGEPDCDDLFEADKMRKARAAEAAEKRKNAPKKTEATKNTEAVEKASSKVEKSVEKRIKSGDVSVAEIKKIIDEYETALKKLRQLLTRAEGKMKYGGPVKDDEIGKLLDKAHDVRDHHCECSGDKYAGGGNLDWFNPKSFTLDELSTYLWDNDMWVSYLKKGQTGITPANLSQILWDGTSHSSIMKQWGKKKLTISDYGQIEVDKGSENVYMTIVVYEAEGSYEPYELRIGSKDNRKGLKEFASHIIDKMSKGGSMYAGGGDVYVPVNEKVSKAEIANFVNYVEMFYGKGEDGLGKDGYTKAQITTAVKKYLEHLDEQGALTWGNGDSLDRERVYPYLLDSKLGKIKNPSLFEGGGGTERDAVEFFTDGGIGMKYIVNGKFDSARFKNDMITRTSKPNAESTIKHWGREMGINVSKYIDGDIIENTDFAEDSTKRAKELFMALNKKMSTGGSMPKGWKHKSKK